MRFLIIATRMGEVKKIDLHELSHRSGLLIDLEQSDQPIGARVVQGDAEIVLVTKSGRVIRFAVDTVRTTSRTGGGVRGIRLAPGDRVVGMEVVSVDGDLLIISSTGYGQRTPFKSHPLQLRGGSGKQAYLVGLRNGEAVAVASIPSFFGD